MDVTLEWTASPGRSGWCIHSYYRTRDEASAALVAVMRNPRYDHAPSHWRIYGNDS